MAALIRTGVQDAKDKFIDPEPTQTSTGNCAAYAAASAIFALNLDRTLSLVPGASDGSLDEQFQVRLARLVERLTDLIYTQNLHVAGGIRRYIDERGASKSLEVIEYSGDGSITQAGKTVRNWDYLVGRMHRGDGGVAFLDWEQKKGTKTETVRHAISLVGNDPDTHEVVGANPWGSPFATVGVSPNESGVNTSLGTVNRAHNLYVVSRKGNFTFLDFHGCAARVYHLVRISKPLKKLLAVKRVGADSSQKSRSRAPAGAARRYEYAVDNDGTGPLAGLAVRLPGLRERDLAGIHSPPGWTAQLWYRDRESFDRAAPELETGADESFAGVVWRPASARGSLGRSKRLTGFGIEVIEPEVASDIGRSLGAADERSEQTERAIRHLVALVRRAQTWQDDEMGAAIVLQTAPGGALARHIRVAVPRRFCEVPAAAERLGRLLASWRPLGQMQRSTAPDASAPQGGRP